MLQVNLKIVLWQATDNQDQLVESEDIIKFGWEMKNSIHVPVTPKCKPDPPELLNVIKCY